MKAVFISLLIGCSALKFVTEENDPEVMHLMVEKNYAESIKTKARIDYYRGDDETVCDVKTAGNWKASFTVEKNGLRKGSTAKVDSCYRVEKWWVNQGESTSDGALRGQLQKDETEHTGGIKFKCVGDLLFTHFYPTDDCKAEHTTGSHQKNQHEVAADIEANWKGCFPDKDKNGVVLAYKQGDYDTLEAISLAVKEVSDNTGSGDPGFDNDNTKRGVIYAAMKKPVQDLVDLMKGNTKALIAEWNKDPLVEGRGVGTKLLGLYQPEDKEFTESADLQTTGEAVAIGVKNFRRQYNFKPPVCR